MRAVLWLVLLPALSACDVYERPGTWRPVGANDANLRAMVADPDDLVAGVADNRADGQVVAAAVARYRAGKVKDLPDSSISKVAPIAAATPAAAASTGAP